MALQFKNYPNGSLVGSGQYQFRHYGEEIPPVWVASTTVPSGNRIHYGINDLSVDVLKRCATAISECSDITYQTITCYVDTGRGYYEFNAQDSTNRITWAIQGTDYQFVLVGFNHYEKTDGTGNAGMTFMCYNPGIGSYTSTSSYYNWGVHIVKDVCDRDLPSTFTTEVYEAMVPVNIEYRSNYKLSTLSTVSSIIFIPSAYEVSGVNTTYTINEGKQWCYFTRAASKTTYLMGGWLYRTCGKNKTGMCIWGVANITSSSVVTMGMTVSGSICPCFCF